MATAKAYPVIGSFGINMERIIHTCLVPAKKILLLRDFSVLLPVLFVPAC
jgi:hypothetical protein